MGAEAEISAGQSNAQRQSALGLVPHSLRGFLHRHQLMLPATEAFFNCTACSPLILERFGADGVDFVMRVLDDPDLLETVSGLADLHKDSASVDVWDYPDDVDESDVD